MCIGFWSTWHSSCGLRCIPEAGQRLQVPKSPSSDLLVRGTHTRFGKWRAEPVVLWAGRQLSQVCTWRCHSQKLPPQFLMTTCSVLRAKDFHAVSCDCQWWLFCPELPSSSNSTTHLSSNTWYTKSLQFTQGALVNTVCFSEKHHTL